MWMALVPCPGRSHDGVQVVVLRLPSQHPDGLLRGGDQLGRVARAARGNLGGNRVSGDRSGHVHHLFDGEADAVAQIKDVVLPALHQVVQRQNVRLGQVVDMDVVAHTGAVLGGIVVAEDADRLPLLQRHLQDNRNQVGLGVVRLTDLAGGVRAAGVKVAQRHIAQAVCEGNPLHHLLHRELGLAVAVGGVGLVALQNRHPFRLAVGGGSGGKDNLVHPMLHHRAQQHHRSIKVVVVIF